MPSNRVYLDWNATAPLRPEARAAMLEAMDVVGNPSSVHAEGRAAKAIVDKARGHVAALVGCERDEVVFTSGATEAAALAIAQVPGGKVLATATEHDCVLAWIEPGGELPVSPNGLLDATATAENLLAVADPRGLIALSAANSETGVLTTSVSDDPVVDRAAPPATVQLPVLSDLVQLAGRRPIDLARSGPSFSMLSAHKLGGPKGVGALVNRSGRQIDPVLRGGGHEMGARSGTENVIGIAGFGAAAEAALRDLESDVWERVAQLRDKLEAHLKESAPELIVFGDQAPRLPNTSCFAVPGWRGETQVIQMDLAGFAISAGSACSSGKVQASRVLMAMGYDEETAGSAVRVSMGPTATEGAVLGFADAWAAAYRRWRNRRAP